MSPHKKSAPPAAAGFTLVELLVTILLAVILMNFAVPSFRGVMVTSKLNSISNDMIISINMARMEAVKRNSSTQFCSNDAAANAANDSLDANNVLGVACGTQTGAVYGVTLQNGAVAAIQIAPANATLAPPLQLRGNMAALRFNSQSIGFAAGAPGVPYNGAVAVICSNEIASNNIYTLNLISGSVAEVVKSSGSCP
jgi:type IV fimbrial biogenesis protein FimT